MPSKKKKYNARFPSGRIKKIMQTDEEVGKVAQAVPVIISRTLELFVNSLLTKAMEITSARNAKTLTPSHMKQCILSESRFDFLKDLVKSLPDATAADEDGTPINYSVQSSNNLNSPFDHRRTQDPLMQTYSRRSTETRQTQPSALGNGVNPNFYTENVEDYSRFGNPVEARNFPHSSTSGPEAGTASSEEEDEDEELPSLVSTATTSLPACVEIDEDYDT